LQDTTQNKKLNKMSREQIDILLSKWISRKLLVFIIACVGLFINILDSYDWVVIATAYVGSETFITIVEKLKKHE
jgi:hypothetical protein